MTLWVTLEWGEKMSILVRSLICLRGSLISLVLAAAMLSAGFVATTFDTALAQGQPALLTPAQVAAIQAQVSAAINAASMQQFNIMVMDPAAIQLCNCTKPMPDQVNTMQCDNPGRLAALAQAIANVTVDLVVTYGPAAAGDITSIILATAMSANVPPSAIGIGLARAANQIAISNNSAAILIAQDLASEGTADIDNCFALGDPVLAAVVLDPTIVVGAGPGQPGAPNPPPPISPVLATNPSPS